MTRRHLGMGVVGVLGLAAAVGVVSLVRRDDDGARRPRTADSPPAAASGRSIAERLRAGEAGALAGLMERVVPPAPKPDAPAATPGPLAPDEAAEWIDLASALRGIYPKFAPAGKARSVEAVSAILARFGADGTSVGWVGVLSPTFDILSAALNDRDLAVRQTALAGMGKLWTWAPGCTMSAAEEAIVADWKERLYPTVARRLADPEPIARAAAVACLGALPIDDKAAPAAAYIRDADFGVRFQTLAAFGHRPGVLSAEAILPLLHDPISDLQSVAEKVLEGRGLNADQIGLGRMITDAKPDVRASAIALLVNREDIDPVVWLLHLTEDTEAGVRLKAIEALADRITPEVRQRLREMAAADDSEEVRAAAEKLAPPTEAENQTAALPPLPGTPSLNPKAN